MAFTKASLWLGTLLAHGLIWRPKSQRPAGTWVPLQQLRHFRELWLSQCKVPWGWGIWIMNICQRELGPSRIIHTQVPRLEWPSSTPNQGLWSRYTEKWSCKQMLRTFIMQLMSKGSFWKSNIKIFLKWFISFPLLCLHHSVITFFITRKVTSPSWRTSTSKSFHHCSSFSSSCQSQDSSTIYGYGKVSLPKKENKEKRWIKQIKLHVIPHHLPLHL